MARKIKDNSTKRILAAVGICVLAIVYLFYMANIMVGYGLLIAFPSYESTYRAAWPTLTGSFIAYDVKVAPGYDDELHFDKVLVDIPFSDWIDILLTKKSRKRDKKLDRLSRLDIEFTGVRSPGWVGLSDELLMFGDTSASPFEAEGCVKDSYWLRSELEEMGLQPGITKFTMAWRLLNNEVIKEQSIATPGVSTVTMTRTMKIRGRASGLANAQVHLTADQWQVIDHGFVAARNQFCADKDGIDEALFIARHIAAVSRYLRADGLVATTQLKDVYQDFVTQGGTLIINTIYAPGIGAKQYAENLGYWTPRLSGTLTHNNQVAHFGLRQVKAKPWPDDAWDYSVFEIMQREGGLAAELLGESGTVVAAAAAQAGKAEQQRGRGRVRSGSQALAGEIMGEPVIDNAAAEQDTAVYIPPPVQKIGPIISDQPLVLSFQELNDYVGYAVKLYSKGQKPRIVRIAGVDKDKVHVRRYMSGGWVGYGLSAQAFLKAELVR